MHLLWMMVVGCGGGGGPVPSVSGGLDVSESLSSGEVRAGQVVTEEALFGGISADGRVGDFKIYNDRVQFVVQGPREGSFYIPQGGNVIDADIVRPDGQLGRDIVDDWVGMFTLGRMLSADSVTVVADGSDGEAAVLLAEGWESPVDLLEGATEGWGLVQDYGLYITTEYRLEPDSYLLQVTSTAEATRSDVDIRPGDGLLGSLDAAERFEPVAGLATDGDDRSWSTFVGKKNDVAAGIFTGAGEVSSNGGLTSLGGVIDMMGMFMTDTVHIPAGDSVSYTRYYGVGPDPAALSTEALGRWGTTTQTAEGTVSAGDGPVAGARVSITLDGEPYTLAITGADGRFSAQVPEGDVGLLAEGRGTGVFTGLPDGAANYSMLAVSSVRERALDALSHGGGAVPMAMGRGVADPSDPLVLGEAAELVVSTGDGGSFEVQVRFVEPDGSVDSRLVRGRPNGWAGAAWGRDGTATLSVEPGTYDVLVHRGARYGYHRETVSLGGGEQTTIDAALPLEVDLSGWLFGDPHCHGAPSPDGKIAMEERILQQAAVGVQVHFGTDHDQIGDYRALLEPLGLDGVIATVVATETSPVIRGHLNSYPLTPDSSAPNNGSWPWWRVPVDNTTEEFQLLRDAYGSFVLQVNHPISLGMADLAGWSPGNIARGDMWADSFDAMELMNGGSYSRYFDLWVDLISRGYTFTATGVTDGHGPFGSGFGVNGSYIHFGVDSPADYTDDALRAAFAAGEVVVSRGAFVDTSVLPGSTTAATSMIATAHSASWAPIDRVELLRDGAVVETAAGPGPHTFELAPEVDAWYAVRATGDTSMAPVYDSTPWAITNPIYVDLAGDGWEAPLAPVTVESSSELPPAHLFDAHAAHHSHDRE